jgi:hypothetical protein
MMAAGTSDSTAEVYSYGNLRLNSKVYHHAPVVSVNDGHRELLRHWDLGAFLCGFC